MKLLHCFWFFAIFFTLFSVSLIPAIGKRAAADSTAIKTSFEANDVPAYPAGSIHSRNNWAVTAGSGIIVADSNHVMYGSQGLKLLASGSALGVQHTPYSGTVPGLQGIVYFNFYVKIISSATRELTVNGYDLFSSSIKRTFVIDFAVPQNDTGGVRVYDGSTKIRIAKYLLNTWTRVSGKVDFSLGIYQVIVNGSSPLTCSFRETYTPTASGTRQANIKEFHQLLMNFGTATNSGSVDAALDSLYIGKAPLHDIHFPEPVLTCNVTVTQPLVGRINLTPPGPAIQSGTTVTAVLSLPAGYRNYGWTGALSGTDTVKVFTVNGDMTLGADVWIDSLNPPAKYSITINQPAFGSIAVTPYFPQAYAGLRDTAKIALPAGYSLVRWTGVLSGTGPVKTFTVDSNIVIGADVVRDTAAGGQRKLFTTAASFKSALGSANPGDTLELADGSYDAGGLTMTRSGTEQNPIILRARNNGAVTLRGSSYFSLKSTWFVTIEGFVFTGSPSSAIKLESCKYTRITRNIFRLSETTSSKWVYIGGTWNQPDSTSHHNRIDHNLFEEKHQLGNMITIDGSSDPTNLTSQYDRIDFNHFRNVGPRATNEMETIRLGWTGLSASNGFGVVEYNLFEECDGDPEIISVKTNDNIIRYNTFVRCQGTVCLRQTNRSTVEGNYFFGDGKDGTGGVRAYGKAHLIFNNYFSGLTGGNWDAAITLTNGDADTNTTSLSNHIRPVRNIVAFNTMVDNVNNIEIGFTNNGSYSKPPKDNIFSGNIVTGSNNMLVKYFTQPVNNVWEKNIMFPRAQATLGITAQQQEILVADPKITLEDSLWRPTGISPAINYAGSLHSFITTDFDGQPRDANKDAGCDELSPLPKLRRPLKPSDVGPNSSEYPLAVGRNTSIAQEPSGFQVLQNYPNPFNPATVIRYFTPAAGNVTVKIYDALGSEVFRPFDGFQPEGWHSLPFISRGLSSGVYLCVVRCGTSVRSVKMILTK